MFVDNLKLMVALGFAVLSGLCGASDDPYALYGRPAPLKPVPRIAPRQSKDSKDYPTSIGGNKSYEYISSFTVSARKDDCYDVMVKIVCPQLYDAPNYPSYGSEYEYVNVWIDWNADFKWTSDEQVMASATKDYGKILANNKILYFTVKAPSKASICAKVKARAMLGWGYNPSDPAQYSWTWGDVFDCPVDLGYEPPTIQTVRVGQHATPFAGSYDAVSSKDALKSSKSDDSEADDQPNKNNSILRDGSQFPIYVLFKIRRADRDSGNFSYTAYIKSELFDKTYYMFPIAKKPLKTETDPQSGVEYGYYEAEYPLMVPLACSSKPTDYGKKKIEVYINYSDANMQLSQVRDDKTCYVFFPHDKTIDGKKLWYSLWKGVVPGLDQFEFSTTLGDLAGAMTPSFNVNFTLPAVVGRIGTATWSKKYEISALAFDPEGIERFGSNGGAFEQSATQWPLDSVTRTVQHEFYHGKAYDAVDKVRYCGVSLGVPNGWVSSYDPDDECKDEWGYNCVGDWLVPDYEDDYGSKNDQRDTFLISLHDGWEQYAKSGDQEYWVRRKVDQVRATEEQHQADWSDNGKMGSKIFKSAKALSGASQPRMKKDAIDCQSDVLTEERMQAVDDAAASFSPLSPSVAWTDDITDVTSDFANEGLTIRSGVTVGTEGDYSFTAYLTGTDGRAIAWSTVLGHFPAGDSIVTFVFSVNTMAKTQAFYEGAYVVEIVECQSLGTDFGGTTHSERGLLTTQSYAGIKCLSDEFYVDGGVSDQVDVDGLVVTIPMWVPAEGDYTFETDLALPDSAFGLGKATVTAHCATGTTPVRFVFSNDVVYASKRQGAFLVKDLRVTTPGVEDYAYFSTLDYLTDEYDYRDFLPDNHSVSIDPESINVTLVPDAGDSQRYRGVEASFLVENDMGEVSLQRFTGRLATQDGKIVAETSENLLLDTSTKRYTLFFSGPEICSSGRRGPYVLKYLSVGNVKTPECLDEYKDAGIHTAEVAANSFIGKLSVDEKGLALGPVSGGKQYQALRLTVPVNVPSDGYVTATAVVYDKDGKHVGILSAEKQVVAGNVVLQLELAGSSIQESGLDGPYVVRNISVVHSGFPEEPCLMAVELKTGTLTHTQFGEEGGTSDDPGANPVGSETESRVQLPIIYPTQSFVAPAARTMSGAILSADGLSVAGVVQLKIGKEKKGLSKVSLTLIGKDGKKYTAKAVNVPVGAGLQRVTINVKNYGLMKLTLGADGFVGESDGARVGAVGDDPAIGPGAVSLRFVRALPITGLLAPFSPTDVVVMRAAKKWTVPKAGTLKYVKANPKNGTAGYFVTIGENIAGLKLTYAPKTQTVKGSFKIWTFDAVKQKIKAVTASVTGVVVGGVAYCDVSVKKLKVGEMIVK